MRVRLPILILVAVLAMSLSSIAAPSEDLSWGMCSAEQAIVEGTSSATTIKPSCSFHLGCAQGLCQFALTISANAVGEARANLFGGSDRADVFIEGAGGERSETLSCESPFSCSAWSFEDDDGILRNTLIVVPSAGDALVRVHCFGGGWALFQSVNCQAKQIL
jgi:hypothetical protein